MPCGDRRGKHVHPCRTIEVSPFLQLLGQPDDSLIVAAALDAGCDTLYSEDMQHSQVVEDRLRLVNPFVGV